MSEIGRSACGSARRRWAIAALLLAVAFLAAAHCQAQGRGSAFAEPEETLPEPDAASGLPTSENELLQLARHGNVKAELRLGTLYVTGRGGFTRNPAEGAKWIRAAAEAGDVTAEGNLGLLYYTGTGVSKDYDEAVRWIRKAADQGEARSEMTIGLIYERGVGLPQNFGEALSWYRKAAAQDNHTAQNNIGVMYDKGEGVAADPAEAVKWYLLAADSGLVVSAFELGNHYVLGKGVAASRSLAYFWYSIAAARASANQSAAAIRLRDVVAKSLPPDEMNRVQQAVAKWKPGADLAVVTAGLSAAAGVGQGGGAPAASDSGSGFLVSRSGHILTNNHVVRSCRQIDVRRPGETPRTAALVNRDEGNDLALLKVAGQFHEAASFRDDRGIRQGDSVVAYGFPLAGILASEGNFSTGTISALAGFGNDSRLLQISTPVQPGNSGGPLIDASGNVVGVIVSKLNALKLAAATGDVAQNVNFAIKASVARDFLDANDVAYRTARSAREMKPSDLADAVKRYTVAITCRN